MDESGYVHGYAAREGERLCDQANTLSALLHHDSVFPEGSEILEAGCGVGAQTVFLAEKNPRSKITCVDISEKSLAEARQKLTGVPNVTFKQGDLFDLPFPESGFDHVFICFVLEHLPDPVRALTRLKRILRPGGTITVIEGDHGSVFFHPDNPDARRVIGCQVALQAENGGNANIGRELYPLLTGAGFEDVRVSPRMVYVDSSRPQLVEGFTKNTFTSMIEGVREKALARKMATKAEWEKGIAGLKRAAEADGVFCYTFFKATGLRVP
ncbi:methyltransferase domain-containing protein [bacterium]|nr:MAG: methyltransferase domain-containing protein [bacterium]